MYPSRKVPIESICIWRWLDRPQTSRPVELLVLVTLLNASSFSKALFFVFLLTQKWHFFFRIKQPILQHLCSLWQQQLGSHSPPLFFFHLSLGLIKTASSSSSSFHHCKREADWKANPNWNLESLSSGGWQDGWAGFHSSIPWVAVQG